MAPYPPNLCACSSLGETHVGVIFTYDSMTAALVLEQRKGSERKVRLRTRHVTAAPLTCARVLRTPSAEPPCARLRRPPLSPARASRPRRPRTGD
eukprot:5472940-Prymnesium_polylepis.1